jgi:hypothetical protein
MNTIRRYTCAALLGAAAFVLLPSPSCPAPTEMEPNDDPAAEGYSGQMTLPAAPFLFTIDGSVSGAGDLDVFNLVHNGAQNTAVVLMDGFASSPVLQSSHPVTNPGDQVSRIFPYALRLIPGWTLLPPAEDNPNYTGVGSPAIETADNYTIRIASPGTRPSKVTASAVFKEATGGDSFKVAMSYAAALGLSPGSSEVRIHVRDFSVVLQASEFQSNGAGTVHKYTGTGALRKVIWKSKKGSISLLGKGMNFAAAPTEGSFPIAVVSDRGGIAEDVDGVRKVTSGSTKITLKRK